MGDTASCVDQGPTVGSLTIALAGPQLRQAAADGRQALLNLAATELGVPAGKLTVQRRSGQPGRRTLRGESRTASSSTDACSASPIPVKGKGTGFGLALGGAQPKAASKYTIVGRSVPRVDIPPKVTGEHFYIQDVRVPGMLHGRVIRPTGLGSQTARLREAVARRPGRPPEELPRRRRRARMGRDPGCAGARR